MIGLLEAIILVLVVYLFAVDTTMTLAISAALLLCSAVYFLVVRKKIRATGTEARKLNLPVIFGTDSPLAPFSKTKPRIAPSWALDFAQTMKTSAIGELEIQVFSPLIRYPLSIFSAVVVMLAGSDPASGSVSPKQPIHSPLASFGRYRRFCSSSPKAWIGNMTRDDCTLIIDR